MKFILKSMSGLKIGQNLKSFTNLFFLICLLLQRLREERVVKIGTVKVIYF